MHPRDYGSGPSWSRQYNDNTRPSHGLAYKKSVEEYFSPSRFHPSSPSSKSLQKLKTSGTPITRAPNEDFTTTRYPDSSQRRPDSGSRQSTKNTFQWIKGELIGQGSHGKVYLGFNATTGELMAVKQVEIPVTADDRRKAELADFVQTLRRERETLRYLDHPNIVQYLRFEENKHTVNIFLQYISGGTIGRCLKEYGSFKEEVTKSFTRQILEGIRYLHSNGIIHRDLKSENILVEPAGVCKISDFGIAKKLEFDRAYSMFKGTYYWMAPEMLLKSDTGYDSKVDVWSVGCIVFEMWTAKRPWHEDNLMQVMMKLVDKKTPPLPEGLGLTMIAQDFRNECLEPNPSKRPTAKLLLEHPYLELPQLWSFPGIPNMGIRSSNGGSPMSEMARADILGSYTFHPSSTRSRSFSSASSPPLPIPPRTITPPLVIIAPPPPRKLPTPQTPVYSRDRSYSITSESSESQTSSPGNRRRLYIHNPEATPDFVKSDIKTKSRDLPRPPTAKPFVYVPPPLPDLDSVTPYSNSLAPLPKISTHGSPSSTRRENATSERLGPFNTPLWGQNNPSTLSLPTMPRRLGPANLEDILSNGTSITISDDGSRTIDTSYSGWQRPPPRQAPTSPRRRPSLPPTPTQRKNVPTPISPPPRQSAAFGGVTRPDNREVLEHMTVYFPDHDLDEPVASSPIDAVFSSPQEVDRDVVLSRHLTLKSIKDIAEEKIHQNRSMSDRWRQTRLWDSNIEEIKPQKF